MPYGHSQPAQSPAQSQAQILARFPVSGPNSAAHHPPAYRLTLKKFEVLVLLFAAPFVFGQISSPVNQGQTPFSASSPAVKINSRDFGAKCDGTTDDTAALQAALNATYSPNFYAGAKENSDILLPQGTCLVTKTLSMGPYGSLEGTGNSSAILADYAAWIGGKNYDVIDAVFAGAIQSQIPSPKQIANLKIIGEGNARIPNSTAIHIYNSASAGNYANPAYEFVGFNLHDLLIDGFDTGIEGEDWSYSSIYSLNIDNTRQPIWLNGSALNLSIGNVQLAFPSQKHTSKSGEYGIALTANAKFTTCSPNCAPQGISIHDSTIVAFNYDIAVSGGVGLDIHDNVLDFGGAPGAGAAILLHGEANSGIGGGIHIRDNFLGVAGTTASFGVLDDLADIWDGLWIVDNYMLNYRSSSQNEGIAIAAGTYPHPLTGWHLDGNSFWQFGTGIFFHAPIAYSEIRDNYGAGQNTALIDLNNKNLNFAGTVIDGNTTIASAPVVAGLNTATGFSLGTNISPAQVTGRYTATGAGCTIEAGAVENSCAATLTLANGLRLPSASYRVSGCGATGASGIVFVGQSAALTSTTFSVVEVALSSKGAEGGTITCEVTAP